MDSSETFIHSKVTQAIHFISAIIIIGLIVIGNIMTGMEDGDSTKTLMYRMHGFSGFLLVSLTIARVYIRIRHPYPHPAGMEGWNQKLYSIVHWGIYISLFILGLSGMGTMLSNGVNFLTVEPENLNRDILPVLVHSILPKVLIVLILLHVGGLLRYQFTKGNILSRMGIKIPIGKK